MNEETEKKSLKLKKPRTVVIAAVVVAAVALGVVLATQIGGGNRRKTEIITVSTLEKIINVSELSTFTAVYNGVAQAMNPEKPENTDYYVSYEARVDVGFDFGKVDISVNDEGKTITMVIPEMEIQNVDISMSSLDFIFRNAKANTLSVTKDALVLCEQDVATECARENAIFQLAGENAIKVIRALTEPIVEQLSPGYTLVVK